ncbi:cytochrome c oxidase assembly protein COX19 [Exaiptasia diaphana]|uniref:Cytochrome c oxidase assembly protein COX19 n=1 Tax=Exaiptasia diaphana TaxID=2652724 RepID=A0A913X918_EXADI|nr:cytochrome c oxidase assembly protein COX19 [Exaiptasia diaphana]KXJ28531.1 Cytochrome c oxidase assembly protein COX19 [Exaiptasia diaphana]
MMAMNTGGRKVFNAKPPDKGSFPLDHDGECKAFMKKYMTCLRDHKGDNHSCREESKAYLECRMQRELMAVEDMNKLGFKDLNSSKTASQNSTAS